MDPNQQPPAATPDAPDKETMEQIRARRLAKLGGPGTASAISPAASSSSTPQPDKALSNLARAEPSPAATAAAASSSKIADKAPQIIRPVSRDVPEPPPGSSASRKRERSLSHVDNLECQPAPRKQYREPTFEEWTDKLLTSILRVSLDPNQTFDSSGHNLTYLPGLSQEIRSEGQEPLLSIDRFQEAVMEAGSLYPRSKPLFEYFLACWKRVNRFRISRASTPEKEEALKEAKRLCFSNCIFAVTMPEMFSREPDPKHDSLVPYILDGVAKEEGLDFEFYNEAMTRIEEDDSIVPLFTKAMVEISTALSNKNMSGDYQPHVQALFTYSRYPALLNALAEHPTFLMAQSAPNIERFTLLGPFFRLSPLHPEAAGYDFASPRTLDKARISTTQQSLQMTLAAHQDHLTGITNAFIRASISSRNKLLDWFAYILNANHKRTATYVDPKTVSTDGFMVNVSVVLDNLCKPFMDNSFTKIDRIQVDYFRRNPRLDIKEETKLNADQEHSDAFYSTKLEGENNFITEVFFLALAAHQYGSEATQNKLKDLDRQIKRLEQNIVLMEAERPKIAHRPHDLLMLEAALKKQIKMLEAALSSKFAIEGIMADKTMQTRSLQFMKYTIVWLLRVASQSDYLPWKKIKLPLPATQPEVFRCLPEYALQVIVDNLKFTFRYRPEVMVSAIGDEVVALCITFLESSDYIKNPYLKSSLVSLLYRGTWPVYHLKKGVLGDILTGTKFANDYLLHAVMKYYIECESNGTSSAFYDKFNIRYEIFHIIKCVWSNDHYKKQLTESSRVDRDFFVRFVNLLMNDATYVLDEALGNFPKIHDFQQKLRDPNLSQEDRAKIESDLHDAENKASSYMQLANETVGMMKLFTQTLAGSFTMPEVVHRLAGMLDFNLDLLTGPKSRTLKVENPDKYGFNPKILLPQLVDIYLNLGSTPAFVEAVAADGRSYKPETMAAATNILRSKSLKDPADMHAWEVLCKSFEEAKMIVDQADLDFGDAPPEFEDPIMGDLMKDPVILPSKHVVDRSTIVQHLLSDPKDPFTRQPMTIDDVVPDAELKAKIEKWMEERRAEIRGKVEGVTPAAGDIAGAAEAATGGDAMDTTD
ncbi:ubiquitin elongating factor core-domain-containing protein [Pseudoneurospora amorphoporcata]|uniref:Ubiquitin elongating factor core-domain-containing protein n=1 Tax=Pseudoneurospora amorphoporcata TaxID=241081 RepID=A0AAN6NPR6_9PEZI|nr:ubiquitin elongating factor core-domain-containing protein [Pseudoneurospora amorphoporcata]